MRLHCGRHASGLKKQALGLDCRLHARNDAHAHTYSERISLRCQSSPRPSADWLRFARQHAPLCAPGNVQTAWGGMTQLDQHSKGDSRLRACSRVPLSRARLRSSEIADARARVCLHVHLSWKHSSGPPRLRALAWHVETKPSQHPTAAGPTLRLACASAGAGLAPPLRLPVLLSPRGDGELYVGAQTRQAVLVQAPDSELRREGHRSAGAESCWLTSNIARLLRVTCGLLSRER